MQNVPPEASLDAILKVLSAPTVSYVLIFLVQRRKLLLTLLQTIYKVVSQQDEEKHRTQESAVVNGNGHKTELVMMNIENVMARLDDTGEYIRDTHRRIDKERRDRLDTEMTINADMARLTLRIEKYHEENREYADGILNQAKQYTDSQNAALRIYIDEKFGEINQSMQRGFRDVAEALRELKDAA